jgi:hypothetical protein
MGIGVAPSIVNVSATSPGQERHDGSFSGTSAISTTALLFQQGMSMKHVTIYAGKSGNWIYEVWIATRAVVVGCCSSREAAEQQASLV